MPPRYIDRTTCWAVGLVTAQLILAVAGAHCLRPKAAIAEPFETQVLMQLVRGL